MHRARERGYNRERAHGSYGTWSGVEAEGRRHRRA